MDPGADRDLPGKGRKREGERLLRGQPAFAFPEADIRLVCELEDSAFWLCSATFFFVAFFLYQATSLWYPPHYNARLKC